MPTQDLIHIIHMAHYALGKGINGNSIEMKAAIMTATNILEDAIDTYNAESISEGEKFDDENPNYIKSSPEEI